MQATEQPSRPQSRESPLGGAQGAGRCPAGSGCARGWGSSADRAARIGSGRPGRLCWHGQHRNRDQPAPGTLTPPAQGVRVGIGHAGIGRHRARPGIGTEHAVLCRHGRTKGLNAGTTGPVCRTGGRDARGRGSGGSESSGCIRSGSGTHERSGGCRLHRRWFGSVRSAHTSGLRHGAVPHAPAGDWVSRPADPPVLGGYWVGSGSGRGCAFGPCGRVVSGVSGSIGGAGCLSSPGQQRGCSSSSSSSSPCLCVESRRSHGRHEQAPRSGVLWPRTRSGALRHTSGAGARCRTDP